MGTLTTRLTAGVKNAYLTGLRYEPSSQAKRARIVYYLTFAANDAGLIDALQDRYGTELVVLATPKAAAQVPALRAQGVHVENFTRGSVWRRNLISYLKQAEVIITDDYLPELAVVTHDPAVYLTWHAAGAIKCFGWEDPANRDRPVSDRQRFQQVYDRYTGIWVGSDQMGQVFRRSWRVNRDVIQPLGFLRSDTLHNQHWPATPTVPYLYAPTYRDSPAAMAAVLEQAMAVFARIDQPVLVKLHPATPDNAIPDLPNNVTLIHDELTPLLARTAVLITDYSSVAFDYGMVRPQPGLVFFCPDLAAYQGQPGLQPGFTDGDWGRLCIDGAQLYDTITDSRFVVDTAAAATLHHDWDQYNDGHVRERILAEIADQLSAH